MPGVFKPVQHYLNHIPYMIRQQGVLKAYSGRSMERMIGQYKKLIKSKVDAGINAGNILDKFMLYNYIANLDMNIKEKIRLIQPKQYNADTYYSLDPEDPQSPQLWSAPLLKHSLSHLPCSVSSVKFLTALSRFYKRVISDNATPISQSEDLLIAGRCWYSNVVYSSLLYRNYKNERRRGNHYIMFSVLHQK